MDIRCGSCSKLFRVADEKIAGKGIRFKCSRCGETVTVTKDDFERDKVSREPAAPSITTPEIERPVPAAQALPAASEQPAAEYQPQEYKPSATLQGMEDFDFSEPNAAAGQSETTAGEFSFGDMAGQEDQEASSEISLSEEDAQEAEAAAFQFPTDIISEPKPLPSSKSKPASPPAPQSEDIDLGAALAMPASTAPAEPLKPAPVVPKPAPLTPAPQPAAAAEADDDMDLGAALAMPKTASEGSGDQEASEGGEEDAAGANESVPGEGIHPFASGNLTGAIAGFLCALPVLYFLTLGFDKTVGLFPVLAALPGWYLLSVSGAGMLGLGIVIGLVIAFIQAQTGRRFLFLVNILIGTLFGAVVGAAMGVVVTLASGGGFSVNRLQADATLWSGASFVISSVLALARAIVTRNREESFAVDLSGLQKAGLGLSGLVILTALYGVGTFAGQMGHAEQALEQQRRETLKKQMSIITPEGLEVVNPAGYVDKATGDLVVSGMVRSVIDKPKQGWYLEAEVYDAGQKVLSVIRVLNGVQMFTQHDRDVLAKRKENADALREKMIALSGGGAVPARGSVPFEIRLYEPPAGMASFLPVLKRFELNDKTAHPQP